MPVLTDLAAAQVKRDAKILYGKVLSRPALLVSDGIDVTYACDVEIGPTDPTGRISQYYTLDRQGNPRTDRKGLTTPGLISGLPGQQGWDIDASAMINSVLRNVTIARNNLDLMYADVGTPVTLTRSASGQWEITGFAQEMPGTYTMVPVDLGNMTIGTIIDLSIDGRLLSLGELGTLEPFGTLPLGASAIFVGGVMMSIV